MRYIHFLNISIVGSDIAILTDSLLDFRRRVHGSPVLRQVSRKGLPLCKMKHPTGAEYSSQATTCVYYYNSSHFARSRRYIPNHRISGVYDSYQILRSILRKNAVKKTTSFRHVLSIDQQIQSSFVSRTPWASFSQRL